MLSFAISGFVCELTRDKILFMAESLELSRKQREHLQKIASKGGKAKVKKYGRVAPDEEKRKKAWAKWWNKEGKLKSSPILQCKHVVKPKHSESLAEFVGIMIGDGGMSEYFLTVTLNADTDCRYAGFVSSLIEDLFRVTPKIRKRKSGTALDVVVHRKELVDFCCTIGLTKGNKLKQGLDIPIWVKKNKEYARACLRGLFDTDGTVYEHHYVSKGKMYHYQKISFSSRSPLLIRSVFSLLQYFCIKSEIAYNGMEVRIQSRENVRRFMQLIGTSNPKHADKYKDLTHGEVTERSKVPHC